jgi:hypothetical protein
MSADPSDIETEKFLNRRADNIKRQRNEIKAAAEKKRRDAMKIIMRPWRNLKKYRKMSMDKKFEFALGGYCFANNPGVPAIQLCTTTLDAPEGRRRGVQVGEALPFLPKGFIILYSEIGRSDLPEDGIQRFYQVGIKGGRCMQIHTDPTKIHGLANFINAGSVSTKPGKVLLRPDLPQNMAIAQCTLHKSTTGQLSPAYREEFPAYVQTAENIPQGHELFMMYGSAHKQHGECGSDDSDDSDD